MNRFGNIAATAIGPVAVVASPILIMILLIQGDWGALATRFAMSRWPPKHNGSYMPTVIKRRRESRARR